MKVFVTTTILDALIFRLRLSWNELSFFKKLD